MGTLVKHEIKKYKDHSSNSSDLNKAYVIISNAENQPSKYK